MKYRFTKLLFFGFWLCIAGAAFGQWPPDPSQNLMICDTTGDQALAKIVSTSDGGCYVSWFDTRSGNYCVYLQRLDRFGYKQWGKNGLLISSNPQDTWIVDYSLTVDRNDYAIVTFSDIRSGNLNVFAYRISPWGSFIWGPNGIALSSTSDFQPNPVVTETSDGNFVFAWILNASPSKVAMQKISPAGQKLWGTTPLLLQSVSGEGYNYPAVAVSDSGSVIVVHTVTTGNFPAQSVKIRAQKISSGGTLLWGVSERSIQSVGGIAAWTIPSVIPDGSYGAFVSWHDDRDNNMVSSAFVQRISSTGTVFFPADGTEVSLLSSNHHFYPMVAFDGCLQESYIFWTEADYNQRSFGICGQKLSISGTRLWGDYGKTFKPLSQPNTTQPSSMNVFRGNNISEFFFIETGPGTSSSIYGYAVDADGRPAWGQDFKVISSSTADKLQMEGTIDKFKDVKLAWGDERGISDHGIYAQNIRSEGNLGSLINWQCSMHLNDSSIYSVDLTFGTSSLASDSIDAALGEYPLPPTPPGYFEAFFELPISTGETTWKDYRNDSLNTIVWLFRFSSGSSGNPVTISWDPLSLPPGSFYLNDVILGSLINVNMKTQNSITLAKGGFWKLKITYHRQICKTVDLAAGWNIVSVPVIASNMNVPVLFPQANSLAFWFNNGYQISDSMAVGRGYWLRYPHTAQVTICGLSNSNGIPLTAGWNMIGIYEKDVIAANLTTVPANIITSPFYGYTNGYSIEPVLSAGKGYWVRASQSGVIKLPPSLDKQNPAISNTMEAQAQIGTVTITDAMNNTSRLTFFQSVDTKNIMLFDLPPAPPPGVFDVRFSTQSSAAVIADEHKQIIISGAEYPVTIRVEGMSIELTDAVNGNSVNTIIRNSGSYVLSNRKITALNLRVTEMMNTTAVSYELMQNYPNPFNPTTTISYQILRNGLVSLIVYDALGREVQTLVNEEKARGKYSVEFNADNLPSGVYFYKLSAGNFFEVKKLLLIK